MPSEDYEPTQVAKLIEHFREGAGLSVRKAAALAEISEGRWRQIAKGYQQATRDVRVPVNAPPETLARMAVAVGMRSGNFYAQGEIDDLSAQVAGIVSKTEETYPEILPVFGGSYEDPNYLSHVEGWVMELQERIEALETKVARLSVKSIEPDPDYSDMSEDEAFELGLAAKEKDKHIAGDDMPNQP